MLFLGCSSVGTDTLKTTLNDSIYVVDLMNLLIDDVYVSSNGKYNIKDELKWDVNTIFWCKFQENLLAGNILIPIDSISSIRIKVREYNDIFWTTIYEYEINSSEDFNFADTYYYLKGNKTKYEFAIVPVLNGTESEYITNTVISDFNGCFLCTKTQRYHAFINLSMNVTSNQNKEFITTLGRKKPFAISNGMANYDDINMNVTFIPMKDCDFDFDAAAAYRREINKFLIENKAIVLKDDQGQRWLVSTNNSISQNTEGHSANVVYDINFTEIGDCDSTTDLYNNGLSDINLEGT